MYLFLTNLCSPAIHIRRHLIFQVSAGTMSSWLHPGLEQPNLCDSTWAGQNASYHFRLAPFPLLRVTLRDNYMPHYISQEINVHHQPSTADCHLSRSVDSVAENQNNWWDFCIFFFILTGIFHKALNLTVLATTCKYFLLFCTQYPSQQTICSSHLLANKLYFWCFALWHTVNHFVVVHKGWSPLSPMDLNVQFFS